MSRTKHNIYMFLFIAMLMLFMGIISLDEAHALNVTDEDYVQLDGGVVNTSDLTEASHLRITGDTTIYINKDVNIGRIYIDNCKLTLKGNSKNLLTISSILANVKGDPDKQGLDVESGNIRVAVWNDDPLGQDAAAVSLQKASFCISGGTIELHVSDILLAGNGIFADSLTLNGGGLNIEMKEGQQYHNFGEMGASLNGIRATKTTINAGVVKISVTGLDYLGAGVYGTLEMNGGTLDVDTSIYSWNGGLVLSGGIINAPNIYVRGGETVISGGEIYTSRLNSNSNITIKESAHVTAKGKTAIETNGSLQISDHAWLYAEGTTCAVKGITPNSFDLNTHKVVSPASYSIKIQSSTRYLLWDNNTNAEALVLDVRPIVSFSKATVALSTSSYEYTGNAIKPKPIVKYNGVVLENGGDYSLGYENNKAVGKATIKVTGKRNYDGKKSISFKINPKGTKINDLKGKKKRITVKWDKQTTQTTGYQIRYSTKSNMNGAKTTKAKKSSTSKTIKKLKKNKKYYVQIRTYTKTADGTFYSKWSKKKSVKTK